MTKKKILIVEGDITLAEKLADRLQEEDFTAEPVTDGKKALNKIRNEWIDAVVLSLKLQGE
ncbi:MAG: response regulator, partial [Candidatus Omnitrophica bacterium]|nr:response regulator [Candidatus Omnitrophota bacterium]